MISEQFAGLLVATFNDPGQHPVHVLFNQWWQHAPDEVKQGYVDAFLAEPRYVAFVEARYYGEPVSLDEMGALPVGTLGRSYRDWIVGNGLEAQIATNYRVFHEALEASGMLDGMPEPLRYAVLRGFQTNDFQHVVTGYDSSGRGEIALQAFCLAQLQFPYFGMWMSVVTTRMTFAEPRQIVPMMDAISDGWQLGRRAGNIQCERWEDLLDQPVAVLRDRYAIDDTPSVAGVASG